MASLMVAEPLKILSSTALKVLTSTRRYISFAATSADNPKLAKSTFTFSFDDPDESAPASSSDKDDNTNTENAPSVSIPTAFMTGSIVGTRFYEKATTKETEDGNGWNVMLDHRLLKIPSKQELKCPTLPLAKAVAAEWEYQLPDGIRPFTMPLMKLACVAFGRLPLNRPRVIQLLIKKLHQDLLFCRAPRDHELTKDLRELQDEKFTPIIKWVEQEFGCKPVVYTGLFATKQEDDLVHAFMNLLEKTDDCELAAIDSIAAASSSLVIAVGIFHGRLSIEEAIELVMVDEDAQFDDVVSEGGREIDIADLTVQISSAAVFLELSRKTLPSSST